MALTEEGVIAVPGMLSRWVRLANGARAHYMTSGETGPAVILLHGGIMGSSGTAGWRFMAPFLGANGFRVYCPDQPGFGLADTREVYRPRLGTISHVHFINDFADALCLEKFHIGGNSMGCINTVHYVTTHPERILSFAIIAGRIGDLIDPSKAITGSYSLTAAMAKYDYTVKAMKDMMESIIYRTEAIGPDLLEMRTQSSILQRESLAAMNEGRERQTSDPNLAQALSTKNRFDRLTIPGICLYGKDDVLLPVENGYMQEDVLPNVQFFYPGECGHQGQTDQPELFNQAYLEFYRDGKVSRKTADRAGVSKRRAENPKLVAQA